jgi:hypothetical protein
VVARKRLVAFLDRQGRWRDLVEPDGPATGAQLARLNREGRLDLVEPSPAVPITKGEAAYAIGERPRDDEAAA